MVIHLKIDLLSWLLFPQAGADQRWNQGGGANHKSRPGVIWASGCVHLIVCDVSAREPASGDQGWSCHPVRSQRESEVRILFVPRQILDQVLDQDQLRHQQHCQCHPHHSQTSGSRQEDICRSQVGKIWLCWY